jgi:hypothetical protein
VALAETLQGKISKLSRGLREFVVNFVAKSALLWKHRWRQDKRIAST